MHPILDRWDLAIVSHALAMSKVAYCNAVYGGLPLKMKQKLQLQRYVAACLLASASRRDHITSVLGGKLAPNYFLCPTSKDTQIGTRVFEGLSSSFLIISTSKIFKVGPFLHVIPNSRQGREHQSEFFLGIGFMPVEFPFQGACLAVAVQSFRKLVKTELSRQAV